MSESLSREDALAAAEPLIGAGVALHWLRPRSKAPYNSDWSNRPVHTLDTLRAEYRSGNNLGVRCGLPSKTESGYLHIIDLDIRKPEEGVEARAALTKLLPDWETLPSVVSGSGGESRHIYIFAAEPMASRKIARSDGWSMVPDPAKGRDVKKRHWEIDLIGTGKQAVLPPSVHPDTGLPYRWERPLDRDFVEMGLYPPVDPAALGAEVSSSDDDDLAALDFDDDEAEYRFLLEKAPLGLDTVEIDRYLEDLPPEYVEDRDTWLEVGMALHHEYGGADAGREKWFEWSKQSVKFDPRNSARVWRSFADDPKRKVITMRSVIHAAGAHKSQSMLDELDFTDDPFEEPESKSDECDYADLLGDLPATVDDDLAFLDKPEKVEPGVNPDGNWVRRLVRNDDGGIVGGLHNVDVLVENDPRIYGRLGFNEFAQSIVLMAEPARSRKKERDGKPIRQLDGPIWVIGRDRKERVNGKRWFDAHSSALRAVFEAPSAQGGWGVKVPQRDLTDAIVNTAHRNTFHPVRDRLRSLKWDGKTRAETIFIDYLGCPDDPYHRQAARLFLLGAVARVMEPGHKFDFVPILEGTQGKRKSTWIQVLGLEWSGELAADFHDNNRMIESLQGSWVLEIPELQGFSKADTTTLKGFVSRTADKGRLAYAHFVQDFPRQCVFIGSTNESDYLRDPTGNRRFWPILCRAEQIDTDRFKRNVEQIWAEVVATYDEMRAAQPHGDLPLYMSDTEAAAIATELQESRRSETPEELLAAEISLALDEPVSTTLEGESEPRTVTCVKEVWVDLLKRDERDLGNQMTTRLIGKAMRAVGGWRQAGMVRHPKHGIQKAWRRSR